MNGSGCWRPTGPTPTNICSWVDNQMWPDRDLTAAEAAAQLARDVRLAHRLGFGVIRPKFGVVSPELDPCHPAWEETVLRTLDLAAELNVVICPEIHSPTPVATRSRRTTSSSSSGPAPRTSG